MTALKTIETKLNDVFKGLPPMPENGKESLVKVWPWIALVLGLLQILAAWALWGLVTAAQRIIDTVNSYSSLYTTARSVGLSSLDKTFIYLGVVVLLVDGVILLMAFPQLQKRNRKGWDLLFLGALLNVGYAIVEIFIHDRGMSSFIFNLIGSAIGFYLLFQVRDKYKA